MRLLTRELAHRSEITQLLVTCAGSELSRRAREASVNVREVPWSLSLDPRALWGITTAIAQLEPAIVHAHDSHALRLAAWGRRLAGVRARLVATRRVDFHLRPSSVWLRTDHVIAISEAVRDILMRDGLPGSAITVVRSGIDPEEVQRGATAATQVREWLELPADTRLALNVAALVAHKDQRTLIRAAYAARRARPELHWLIAGEGELRAALQAEIARLGVGDRVHLLGHVAHVDPLIREADVIVMSSKEEGLGSVVLHALALGKPVVATRGGGLPEIVPAEWLVPVGNADALARKVLAALDHPARLPLPARFTASHMANGVLAVYQSLI